MSIRQLFLTSRAAMSAGIVAVMFVAGDAAAQSAGPVTDRPPRFGFTVGAGPRQDSGEYHPMAVTALQVVAGRWLSIEGELAYWSARSLFSEVTPEVWRDTMRRRVMAPSANVLFRAGTSRITGFAGAGVGVQFVRSRLDEGELLTFIPSGRIITVPDTRGALHLLGGIDVRLGRRLGAWASVRSELLPDGNLGVAAGLRTTLSFASIDRRSTPPAGPGKLSGARVREGQEIRVTSLSGDRTTGRFVSLSENELVMRRANATQRVPLDRVRRIELVAHHARNGAIIGLAAGVGLAFAGCVSDDNFCGDDAAFGVLATIWGGIGVGTGAGLGALINVSTADRHLIYARPEQISMQLQPIAGPRRAGAVLRVRW